MHYKVKRRHILACIRQMRDYGQASAVKRLQAELAALRGGHWRYT